LSTNSIPQERALVKPQEEKSITQTLEKWYQKRAKRDIIGKKMISAGYKARGWAILKCGNRMAVEVCENCGRHNVRSTNLCRDKLCPVCRWRLSLRRYAEMVQTCDIMRASAPDLRYKFMTLTVKNCAPEDLDSTLRAMASAWNRITQRKFFKQAVEGTARSVEITYNKKTGEVHPHYHVIIALHPTCTAAETEGLRNLSQMWQRALKVTYGPIVDVRDIEDKGITDISAAVCETFKYAVKDKTLEDMPLKAFSAMVAGINGKRMTSFSGIFKRTRTYLGFNDADEVQDEDAELKCKRCGAQMQVAIFEWAAFEGVPETANLAELLSKARPSV